MRRDCTHRSTRIGHGVIAHRMSNSIRRDFAGRGGFRSFGNENLASYVSGGELETIVLTADHWDGSIGFDVAILEPRRWERPQSQSP